MGKRFNEQNIASRNREIMQMPNIRVFYRKTGRVKYISHLDIMRCMQRALKRAGIPVWYTQGYNPHMYMTFALPLSLGYESVCECMDLRLEVPMELDEVQKRLDKALPEGLTVWRVAMQEAKPQEIAKAEYDITFLSSKDTVFSEQFDAFCEQKEIIVMKRTKKGEKPIDLKPEFEILGSRHEAGKSVYTMCFTAGQKNINPTLLIDAALQKMAINDVTVRVLRKQIYKKDGKPFA